MVSRNSNESTFIIRNNGWLDGQMYLCREGERPKAFASFLLLLNVDKFYSDILLIKKISKTQMVSFSKALRNNFAEFIKFDNSFKREAYLFLCRHPLDIFLLSKIQEMTTVDFFNKQVHGEIVKFSYFRQPTKIIQLDLYFLEYMIARPNYFHWRTFKSL